MTDPQRPTPPLEYAPPEKRSEDVPKLGVLADLMFSLIFIFTGVALLAAFAWGIHVVVNVL